MTHTKNSAQVKADAKVEVDLEAAEELMVTRADFLHALKHDVKPALGSAEDLLQVLTKLFPSPPLKLIPQSFLSRGIVDWSPEIASILADGELLLQQAASTSGPGLVSILIEVKILNVFLLRMFALLNVPFRVLLTPESLHWPQHWPARVGLPLSRYLLQLSLFTLTKLSTYLP